jgi:hypothetical protein
VLGSRRGCVGISCAAAFAWISARRAEIEPSEKSESVKSLGLLQDGDAGVGVLPEGEKVFVAGEGAHAGDV